MCDYRFIKQLGVSTGLCAMGFGIMWLGRCLSQPSWIVYSTEMSHPIVGHLTVLFGGILFIRSIIGLVYADKIAYK